MTTLFGSDPVKLELTDAGLATVDTQQLRVLIDYDRMKFEKP